MFKNHLVLETDMVRIPGLFRRWELPQVLTNQLAFRIEDAGAHEDGTPLLAIYTAGDGHPEGSASWRLGFWRREEMAVDEPESASGVPGEYAQPRKHPQRVAEGDLTGIASDDRGRETHRMGGE